MRRGKKKAWVLAEWLTALALLAVIAMIALPNYFEAKTRGDVSQVLADLRRLETAMTSYRLDNGRWMPDMFEYIVYRTPSIPVSGSNDPFIYGPLTTPVTYLGTIPLNPFESVRRVDNTPVQNHLCYHYYGQGWQKMAASAGASYNSDNFLGQWIFLSSGPDHIFDYGEWSMYIPEREANGGASPREYDPTNGAVSSGDIVRWENMERSLLRLQ